MLMYEAKRDSDWEHTASLMALLANINRDPKKTKPISYMDFMPKKKVKPPMADISVLKSFLKK